MNKGDRRRGRERQAIADYEADGFVPAGAWRSCEARLDAMEHAMRSKIAHGARIVNGGVRTWARLPAWAR